MKWYHRLAWSLLLIVITAISIPFLLAEDVRQALRGER